VARRPALRRLGPGRLLLALTLCAAVWSGLSEPAGAASNGLWSIAPTATSGQAGQPYVEVSLSPGASYESSVTIDNLTAAPLTLNVYAADALNPPGGGLSLRGRTSTQEGLGSWTHLAQDQVTLPAGGGALVPFVIDVPADARAGDHVGGIVAEETQGSQSSSRSLPVTVLQAVGVRIYARVSGTIRPGLAVHGTSVSVSGGTASSFGGGVSAKVRFTVTDTGNTVLNPHATVSLSTPFGDATAPVSAFVGQLLPGSSVSTSVTFPQVTPWGHLHAGVTTTTGDLKATGSATATVIPWGLVAIVVVVLVALVVAGRRWRRRRSARRVESGAADQGPEEPDPVGAQSSEKGG
jgi:WxL Interacting Protein, peptidoglycan binding domain